MTTCYFCENDYVELGTHWRWNPEHRPDIDEHLSEVIAGVLMGDGCINHSNGGHPNLRVKMINEEFLRHLNDIFGDISADISLEQTALESASDNIRSGFSTVANTDNYSNVYLFRTRNHPDLTEFAEWYSNGEKEWKVESLTPTMLKYWYVCDGTYNRNHIELSMNETYFDKATSLLSDVGLPTGKTRTYKRTVNGYEDTYGGKLRFTVSETNTVFEYMGEALPGFKYKWPNEKV